MFLKLAATFQKSEDADLESVYTLTVTSPIDQIFQYFPAREQTEVREDLIEVEEGDAIDLLFTSGDQVLAQLTIQDLATKEWTLTPTDGSSLALVVTPITRAPRDWFDAGLELLTSPRPWYFKAEDIYNLTKYILEQYKVSTSRPVIEIIRAIDFASFSVAKNLLSVRLDEGFSLVSSIDDLLESLLSSTDKTVDAKLLQVALSLQKLRKAVTCRLQELSFFTQEKLYLLRAQANSARGLGNIDSAYIWAVEATEQTTNRVKVDIAERLRSLRDAGRAVLAALQSRVYNRVTDQVTAYQRSLFDLPAYAHPYVIGAVGATQPYIAGALETAAPFIQTLREKTPVDTWINDTKDVLERNAAVAPYVVAATNALEEVKNYCTNEQYFEPAAVEQTSPLVGAN
jgi:hypothetical protein